MTSPQAEALHPVALQILRTAVYTPLPQRFDTIADRAPIRTSDRQKVREHVQRLVDIGLLCYATMEQKDVTNDPDVPEDRRFYHPTIAGAMTIQQDMRDRESLPSHL